MHFLVLLAPAGKVGCLLIKPKDLSRGATSYGMLQALLLKPQRPGPYFSAHAEALCRLVGSGVTGLGGLDKIPMAPKREFSKILGVFPWIFLDLISICAYNFKIFFNSIFILE